MDRRHAEQYQSLNEKYEKLRAGPVAAAEAASSPARVAGARGAGRAGGEGAQGTGGRTVGRQGSGTSATAAAGTGAQGTGGRTSDRQGGTQTRREAGGIGAQGTDARTFVREGSVDEGPIKRPAKVSFSDGLEFASEDDEFKLTFHDLTQAEFRGFPAAQRGLLQDQFFIPRQRWYFTGQVTRSVEFYTAINRGYGSLDLLDAFITLNPLESLKNDEATDPTGAEGTDGRVTADRGRGTDSRARFRIGRMKTPYLNEYFSIAEGDLIAPERSLYAGNFAGNRQDGGMILGELFEQRIGYAVGLFNGPRRSFNDFNSDKDFFFRLNARPFLRAENEDLAFLKYLNVGVSGYGGRERNPLQPSILTTANDQSSASSKSVVQSLSPTILAFNNNVTELGDRLQGAVHLAYFYKSLAILAEYGAGYQGYSNNGHTSTRVPLGGYMVQGTYFLTGEELTRRVNVVRPLRRFGYTKGQFGLGAFEVHARYSEMSLGKQVFTGGFADPNQWSNSAYATDVGVNWYWNYYTKMYFDWQHTVFGLPVATGVAGRLKDTSDLFWVRFQVFF